MHLPYQFGRYTLVEKIACGGTAELYRAVLHAEEGFAKTVAVKRLLPSWCGSDEVERMLIDEARVLTHLQHGSIVQVIELGRAEGAPFIAMEFVDGIDCARLLTELIRDREPLPLPHALYVIGQVLLALECAHRSVDASGKRLGVVHRDISPSNILLAWNGEAKVTDFGIAKGLHRTRETCAGQLRGKFAYMAPEQARGESIDPRADLFACGAVLFELLTATRLFDGRDDIEVLERVRRADWTREAIGGMSPEVRSLLTLALSADREQRYQSAAEMLSDVGRIARREGEPVTAIEFSGFLCGRFPRRRLPMEEIFRAVTGEEPPTKPMALSEPFAAGARKVRQARAALLAALLAAVMLIPPASSKGKVVHRMPTPEPVSSFVPMRVVTVDPPHPSPGAIAIDSNPPGLRGWLMLPGERRRIQTPFALEGIAVGDGVEGAIELVASGYRPAKERFRLEPSRPTFAKKIDLIREKPSSLSVQARPWGLVDIAGYASGQETPVAGLKLKAGRYLVKVRYPPSGRVVAHTLILADGETRRCFATFEGEPKFSCR